MITKRLEPTAVSVPIKKARIITLAVGAMAVLAVALCREPIAVWLRFHSLFEPIGLNEQGLPEYRHKATGIIMVRVPGADFLMGSPRGEDNAREHEQPQHEVTLSPFLIAKYEVTRAEWATVMGGDPPDYMREELPPINVSWQGVRSFEEKTGLTLPTEAQWEYACRAGQSGRFSGSGVLDDMGWYDDNANWKRGVGEKQPNQFGLHDMHGNVWEWCEDVWDHAFYEKTEATRKNPVCLSGSDVRVTRGGSWYSLAEYCRSAFRSGNHPSVGNQYLGFRPAYYPLP